MAPYFGNSVYVWGSLIGVFLAALSLGYFLGGRIATRWPSWGPFLAFVLAAGACIYPIPHVASGVLGAIADRDYGPRANPLIGATVLFFLPSVLLGTISPYAVRLRARSVEGIGSVAGALYALSTLGSIVGTLLAAFVLISSLGVHSIIQILGGTEMGLAVIGFLWMRRMRGAAAAAAVIAIVLAAGTSVPPDGPGVVYARDTVYHRISVTDDGDYRYLRLDQYWQSGRDLTAPLRTVFPYTDYLHLATLFAPPLRHVLFVGLGGGTAQSRFFHDYPDAQIDVVEIDPAVVDTARRYFALPSSPRLAVHVQDGRLWIRRTPARYDLIVLDAYLIDTIPFHLATREFYENAAAHLTPGGVVESNVIGAHARSREPAVPGVLQDVSIGVPGGVRVSRRRRVTVPPEHHHGRRSPSRTLPRGGPRPGRPRRGPRPCPHRRVRPRRRGAVHRIDRDAGRTAPDRRLRADRRAARLGAVTRCRCSSSRSATSCAPASPIPAAATPWEIVRLGADIGLRCTGCGRHVLMPRVKLERRIKEFLTRGPGAAPAPAEGRGSPGESPPGET